MKTNKLKTSFAEVVVAHVDAAWTNYVSIGEPLEQAATKAMAWMHSRNSKTRVATVMFSESLGRKTYLALAKERMVLAAKYGVPSSSIAFIKMEKQVMHGKQSYACLVPQGGPELAPVLMDAKTIFRLMLAASILSRVAPGARKTAFFSNQVMLGGQAWEMNSKSEGRRLLVKLFEPRMAFDDNEVQLWLSSQRYMCNELPSAFAFSKEGDDAVLANLLGGAHCSKLDGRLDSLPDISFDQAGMSESKLLHLNWLCESFCNSLSEAGIFYERNMFKPTHVVKKCYMGNGNLLTVPMGLSVVNLCSQALSKDMMLHMDHALTQDGVKFKSLIFANGGAPCDLGVAQNAIKADLGVLCINPVTVGMAMSSSCVIEGVPHEPHHGQQVLDTWANDGEYPVCDAYTQLKRDMSWERWKRGARGSEMAAIQGLNWHVDGQGGLISCDTSMALRKCAMELAIKIKTKTDSFSLSRDLGQFNFEACMTWTKKVKILGEKKTIHSLVWLNLSVNGSQLTLSGASWHPDLSNKEVEAWSNRFPVLKHKIGDGSLVLHDTSRSEYLWASSGLVPAKIILNAKFKSMQEALSHKNAMATSLSPKAKPAFSRDSTQALLPYYVNPGVKGHWRNDCFIHAMSDRLRYFSQPTSSLEIQSGFHNLRDLKLFKSGDLDGALQAVSGKDSMNSRLAQVYLLSVNHGVMILGGASKSSIIEKLALLVSGC